MTKLIYRTTRMIFRTMFRMIFRMMFRMMFRINKMPN